MPISEYQKQTFRALLTGSSSPFPSIYDAVSEQIFLLIFKARQLNGMNEFKNWFTEQHEVLGKLRDKNDKINEIYSNEWLTRSLGRETLRDPLLEALVFMRQLYEGFDAGNISLKTWGEMNKSTISLKARDKQRLEREVAFIMEDLFSILTDSNVRATPIPAEIRNGYSHQDLSIAHSCSDVLLARLDAYYDISAIEVLAETLCEVIYEFQQQGIACPDWLSEFERLGAGYYFGAVRTSPGFKDLVDFLQKSDQAKFIDSVFAQGKEHEIRLIVDLFIEKYATAIKQWIDCIFCYLKTPRFTSYRWKFKTVTTAKASINAEIESQEDGDYCQILISRDNLLELIQTRSLHDAAMTLADCLLQTYTAPAKQGLNKGLTPPISDNELKFYSSDSYLFSGVHQNNYSKHIDILKSFEYWYEKNKVLFVSVGDRRTEKISVSVRRAGLKCYDLKMGIPNGKRMRIQDGVYSEVRGDENIRLSADVSDISLQRYHSKVKSIITSEIDLLIEQQRNSNEQTPFSGALFSIKPLWNK